jgi:hypothetical protein
MTNLDELERLAKAATPGPWRGDRIDGTVKYDIVAGDYPNGKYTVVCHGDNGNACDGGYGFANAENEAYALAANPASILELVAEVRALRERNQLTQNVVRYADSVCGMLRGGGWPGKAEALESRIKAVIEFDEAQAKEKA